MFLCEHVFGSLGIVPRNRIAWLCGNPVFTFLRILVLVAHACNPYYSDAEIRRIAVQSQTWQIVPETLSQKNPNTKTGLVECASSRASA
jgi:hypothetical protein